MSEKARRTTCKWCGTELEQDHTGPCPKCGRTGKNVDITLHHTVTVKSSSIWEKRREFTKTNPVLNWLIIIISFGLPFLGLLISRLLGLIIGILAAVILYLLGPIAITKIRETERGKS